jgi:hypothetical protein
MPGGGIPRPITPGGIPGENVENYYNIVLQKALVDETNSVVLCIH